MPNDILISGVQTLPRSESDVRYNYYNTNQIIGGANLNPGNQAQLYSSDGGQTWGQSILPSVSPDVRQSDPAVDWTSDGNAWALTIGINASQTALTLRCFKSVDGGKTWNHDSDLSGSQTSTDKPALWVDHSPTSPYKDHMYATWHTGATAWAAWRAGTAGAWSAPIQLSGSETVGTADGGDIKANTYGDVFAFWPRSDNRTLQMAKSINGGSSFGTPVQIASTFATFLVPIPAQDERECLIYISGGAYKTATLDMVYAVWMDLEGGSGCNALSDAPGSDATSTCKTRIWFSSSADGGTMWSTPVMLNNQSSLNDQFFPRLAVDETNGNMMLVYYDTVADPKRLKADVWMQSSIDNGATWTSAVKITSSPTDETSDEDLGNQYGDYIGLTGYGGQFFACWTDRRDQGLEQIYGAPIVLPFTYFTLDKNVFGVDEVDVDSTWNNDFWVVVEGASPNSLGSNKPALGSGGFNGLAPTVQLQENHSGPLPFPTPEQPTELDTPQRISFPYNVVFSGTPAPPFPSPGGPPIVYPLNASISFQGRSGQNALNAPEVAFELTAGEDPYFQNVDPSIDNEPYLSQDLRVFTIVPGWLPLANAMPGAPAFAPTNTSGGPIPYTSQDPAAAYNYIKGLLTYLKDNYSDGASPDPFASMLEQGQALTALSSVIPSFPDLADIFGPPLICYNFAIARVRLKAASGSTANGVKVFFRLWTTQSTDTDYDPTFTYLSKNDGSGLPSTPEPGPGNVTYPFLASGDYSTASINADYGTDGDPNYHDITTGSMDTGYGYYGCFLNLYDLNVQLNVTNAGTHHCLVAQIAYDDAPIPIYPGASPTVSSMDKLAQRNLQISPSDNPGPPSAHRIPQSFDLRPSPVVPSTARGIAAYPDELMILWGNVPRGTKASIYWPQVDSGAVLGLASRLYAGPVWSATDAHTVQCTVSQDFTYLPIPAGTGSNFSGLFTLDLPTTVVRGETFNVVVHRIGTWRSPQGNDGQRTLFVNRGGGLGDWRYIIGSFQVQIPVATAATLLGPEESKLAILKWRLSRMAPGNRWYPVLKRLVGIIWERVKGLGGNPIIIPGSPSGYHPGTGHGGSGGHGHGGSGHGGSGGHGHGGPPDDFLEFTGKISGIVYDRFGDFEGFHFRDEEGYEHSFHGREREVEKLVYRAWEERIVVTIRVKPHAPHWPASIIYRHPPTF
jgi:hypothetical protein